MNPQTVTNPSAGGFAFADTLMALAPKAALVVATIIGGVILSRLARRGVRWLVDKVGLEALAEKVGVSKMLYAVGVHQGLTFVLGQLAYYVGLMFTVATVSETLGLPGVAQGITYITGLIPRIFGAGLIAVGGFVGADVARSMVGRLASKRQDLDSPNYLAQAAYYGVLVITLTMTAEHLGFNTELINTLIELAVGAVFLGGALAFALGAKPTFTHIVARFYAERMFRTGDRIAVDGVEGSVLRFGPAGVILDTPGGEVVVPCFRLMDNVVRLDRVERRRAEEELDPTAETPPAAKAP